MDALTKPSVDCVAGDRQKMVQAISCVVKPGTATYVSGPITTGLKFIEWYMREGKNLRDHKQLYNSSLRENVIRHNEFAILDVAVECRRLRGTPVIEPASLFIPEWSQPDYIDFWISVLREFVCEIVLVESWQFSAGCVAEFNFAVESGYVIRAHDDQVISREVGRELIESAVHVIEKIAADDVVLCALAASLRKVV